MTEDAIQRALIHWIKENYPGVRVLAIRNEDMRKRTDEIEVGHPDLQLEATDADHIECILKLELKTTKGKLSKKQLKWNETFDDGYRKNCLRKVAYGFSEARRIVSTWIGQIRA